MVKTKGAVNGTLFLYKKEIFAQYLSIYEEPVMEQCKKVNLVFLINTLMPYVVFIILELLKIETIGPLEGFIVSQGVFANDCVSYPGKGELERDIKDSSNQYF